MPITLGKGSMYKADDVSVAPSFSSSGDARRWQDLAGSSFSSIIVVLDPINELARRIVEVVECHTDSQVAARDVANLLRQHEGIK